MAEFTFYNNSYFRNEDGKLIPVTDPDTLKALKANQLPHKVEPMGRSLTFAEQVKGTQVSAKPSPYAVAGGGTERPASTSLPGQGDVKSTFNSLLQNALKSFAGASNVEELRARKDSLIARQMVAPTSAPGMETRPDFGTKLISDRGAEFGGALSVLDTEISKAKQGDADTISKLNSLMSIGEKLGLIGDKTKAADVKEIDGQLVERQDDGTWKVVFGTKKLSAEESKAVEAKTSAQEKAQNALEVATRLKQKIDSGAGTYALGKSQWLTVGAVPPGTQAADLVADFNQLKGLLTLDAIKYLKGTGPLSDSDIKLLKDSAAALSRSQSEKAFNQTLAEITSKLETALSGTTVASQTKVINGVTYTKTQGGWKKQ